jgi:putative ubiquitin-RnfH superfamily antitoxin RatB of RatAB toxin-antitoxin module
MAETVLGVQICYATATKQWLLALDVAPGTTLHQAIIISGILLEVPEIDLSVWKVGVFGKLKPLDAVLRQHDRVEIYRPLTADPMESRRRRAGKRTGAA